MKAIEYALLFSAALMMTKTAWANPADDSCRLLEVAGQNKVSDVEPLINDLATQWAPQSRENAISTLQDLLSEVRFDGGNAYMIAKLGEDYEDHILAIRIAGGELAAARLTYEWTPAGMRLTVLNFQRRISQMFPIGMPTSATLIECD